MWYEILPGMAIMAACLSVPGLATVFAQRWSSGGKVSAAGTPPHTPPGSPLAPPGPCEARPDPPPLCPAGEEGGPLPLPVGADAEGQAAVGGQQALRGQGRCRGARLAPSQLGAAKGAPEGSAFVPKVWGRARCRGGCHLVDFFSRVWRTYTEAAALRRIGTAGRCGPSP